MKNHFLNSKLKNRLKKLSFIFILSIFSFKNLYAEDTSFSSIKYSHLNGYFQNNYIQFGLGKSYPVGKSRELYSTGPRYFTFQFSHLHNETWLLGIKAEFKRFLSQYDEFNDLAIWSVYHKVHKLIRLYHPLYLGFGGSLSYLSANKNPNFPLEKDDKFEREVGAGIDFSFYYIINSNFILDINYDRWRGTKTTMLQGYNFSISLGYALN